MTIERFETTTRLSQAVRGGGLVFLTGQVATDARTDAAGQTRQILEQIERLLVVAGTSRERVLSATIFLADLRDFDAMNAVWDAWVPRGAAPARTTVAATLLKPEFRIEIQATALA